MEFAKRDSYIGGEASPFCLTYEINFGIYNAVEISKSAETMEHGHEWTFFTNHAHVLVCLASNPDQSLRQVALSVGITERAVQRIVAELEEAGFLERRRVGRRNQYAIHMDKQMRHKLESHCSIGKILQPVLTPPTEKL